MRRNLGPIHWRNARCSYSDCIREKGILSLLQDNNLLVVRKVQEFGYLLSKFGGERQVDDTTKKYGVALVFEPTESQNFLIGSSREFNGYDTKVDWNVV